MVPFRSNLASALIALIFLAASARAAEDFPLLNRWLASQTNVQTWSADVVQTRTLKTLAQPLVANGKIWFSAPNRFHWELGSPPQTIAIRGSNEMVVLYPKLKRAERYPLDKMAGGPMRDLMTLIDAGFPRTRADLDAEFKVLGVEEKSSLGEIRLQPKSAAARKLMPELRIVIDPKESHPRATEMHFADGSTMRNDFTNIVVNPKIDASVFDTTPPGEFKITEPFAQGK